MPVSGCRSPILMGLPLAAGLAEAEAAAALAAGFAEADALAAGLAALAAGLAAALTGFAEAGAAEGDAGLEAGAAAPPQAAATRARGIRTPNSLFMDLPPTTALWWPAGRPQPRLPAWPRQSRDVRPASRCRSPCRPGRSRGQRSSHIAPGGRR